MSARYRMYPTSAQAAAMAEHCAHARYVWNLALEQADWYRPQWGPSPRFVAQCRQLTEARAAFVWLADGSQTVQQQALRDFDQALSNWRNGTHRRPTWRKKGRNEGFRIAGFHSAHVRRLNRHSAHVRRLNRRWAEVSVPKIGWVRFRWTRPVGEVKSYRVTLDASGRWHIAFASVPALLTGPCDGSVVGIDRGVAITLSLSDGTTYQAPAARSVKRLPRRLARAKKGSNRRQHLKRRLARVHARNGDARRDWVEKTSTTIAKRYDLIRIEDLRIRNMTRSARGTVDKPGRNVRQKSGLNRAILAQGWGQFDRRLNDKAAGRVEKINPAFTSQRCSGCGHVATESRESQSRFCCVACGYTDNADLNAATNIAAGHAVTARRGLGVTDLPTKREPHLGLRP